MNPKVVNLLFLLGAISCGKATLDHGGDCVDGVDIDNYCYRLPYRAGPRITYQEASDLCRFHGGILAEIHSEEVYLAIFRYIKRSWYYESDAIQVQVWLGARLNRADNTVYLLGGGRSYVEWFPGYPTPTASQVKVALDVPTKPSVPSRSGGMFDALPTKLAVPLCQFRHD